MRHVVDPGIQGALVAPVRHFEHHPGPRLTLKVVHGDEPTDRLNLRDQRRESFFQPAVPIQNLNPDVLMMEPAEDWYRCDAADLLRPPKIWSIFIQ